MQQRIERASRMLVKEVSEVIREDVHDPELGFVTIMRAEVAKDLKSAKIYYSVLGTDEERSKTESALRQSQKEIKKLVNDRIRMRYAIDIKLIREEGIEQQFKIDEILQKIELERREREKNEGI